MAKALALVARTMATATLGAFERGHLTGEARPLVFAIANPVGAGSVVVAQIGAGLKLARDTAPAFFAGTREGFFVALAVTKVVVAVVDALLLLAVGSAEAWFADALRAGVVLVCGGRAVTLVANALGSWSSTVAVGLENALAVVVAVVGAVLGGTVFAEVPRFALANPVGTAFAVAGAVVGALGLGAVEAKVRELALASSSLGVANSEPAAHGLVRAANRANSLGAVLPGETFLAVALLFLALAVARAGRAALPVTTGRTVFAGRAVETRVADANRAVRANVAVTSVVALVQAAPVGAVEPVEAGKAVALALDAVTVVVALVGADGLRAVMPSETFFTVATSFPAVAVSGAACRALGLGFVRSRCGVGVLFGSHSVFGLFDISSRAVRIVKVFGAVLFKRAGFDLLDVVAFGGSLRGCDSCGLCGSSRFLCGSRFGRSGNSVLFQRREAFEVLRFNLFFRRFLVVNSCGQAVFFESRKAVERLIRLLFKGCRRVHHCLPAGENIRRAKQHHCQH